MNECPERHWIEGFVQGKSNANFERLSFPLTYIQALSHFLLNELAEHKENEYIILSNQVETID